MPKNRKTVKIDGSVKVINMPSKNRIGSRSAGSCASMMSTKALMKIAEEKGKRGHKARTELNKRKV